MELALAERPSGLTVRELTDRLEKWDMGDVVIALRRRPDLFAKSGERWVHREAALLQEPRRVPWTVPDELEQLPTIWSVFADPRGAAKGWREFCDRMHEIAFDPETAHIALSASGRNCRGGLRLHVDHTILFDRPSWLIWAIVRHIHDAGRLEMSGLLFWNPNDPRAVTDATHLVSLADRKEEAPLLATWSLRTPLELAESLTYLLLDALGVLDPRKTHIELDKRNLPPAEEKAMAAVRGVWSRRQLGEVIGHCQLCGRPLSDENSAALGYGPECASRLGLQVVRDLHRGRDAALYHGAVPLAAVLDRVRREAPPL